MNTVLVLLSTYNGENYLPAQLQSLYDQKDCNCTILVRDDRSSDNTCNILEAARNEGKLKWYTGENLKPAKSFWNLVQNSPSEFEYYAFCDQDDVWQEDKLLSAIEQIKAYENIPCMYCSAYQMTDRDLNPIPTPKLRVNLTLHNSLLRNIATGCTMVFNKALMDLLKKYSPDFMHIHDDWVYKICMAVGGKVIYDEVPHIFYRQHGNNSIGGLEPSLLETWMTRIRKFFQPPVRRRYKICCELKKGYYDMMPQENKDLIDKLTTYLDTRSNWTLAFDGRFYKGLGFSEAVKVFVMFLFRYY